MTDFKKPPPVGSDTFTLLLNETLMPRGSLSIQTLSELLGIQQFYILQHLWGLKLTGRYQDLIDRVSGVSYDRMPEGIRHALKSLFPEAAPAPSEPLPADSTPVSNSDPVTPPKEKKPMKQYGRLAGREADFVEYIRTNNPKTTAQLARVFGVEQSTVRRYLYGMLHNRVNLDCLRKVKWSGATTTEVPPYLREELAKYGARFVEVPLPAPITEATSSPRVSKPVTAPVNSTVDTLEKLVLKHARSGEFETVKALATALGLVEASNEK